MEDYLREFRGFVDGILEYTFPLHWIDEILYHNNILYEKTQLLRSLYYPNDI